MKTISSCVKAILSSRPFLEDALSRHIINYSALAEDLNPIISKLLKKQVKSGAIMMALRRYDSPISPKLKSSLSNIFSHLGDITLRSNLIDYTFQNSNTLINNHSRVLKKIDKDRHVFYAFTRGIHESNLIISSSKAQIIESIFPEEILLAKQNNLSSISINLPSGNTKIVGLYYQIFRLLAWENITLFEVVSTTNEFIIVVEDHLVEKAFSVISRLKTIDFYKQ